MNTTFENCVDCPHFEGEREDGYPNCKIFMGTLKEFKKKCPTMQKACEEDSEE